MYAPIHVYEAGTQRPVAFILRPAKTPSGNEIVAYVHHLIRRIRTHWPEVHITLRGDGYYARPEVMVWCEKSGVDYIFGLPGNAVLKADPVNARTADACAVHRAVNGLRPNRVFCETTYAAKSWGDTKRRVIARIEASTFGMDVRTIVTSFMTVSQGSSLRRIGPIPIHFRRHAHTQHDRVLSCG